MSKKRVVFLFDSLQAAAVTDETTDEDLGKVHEELEKGIADVRAFPRLSLLYW